MSRLQHALRAFPPGTRVTREMLKDHQETQRQLDQRPDYGDFDDMGRGGRAAAYHYAQKRAQGRF